MARVGPTGGKLRYDLILGLKLYILMNCGMRPGDVIHEIHELEDPGSGKCPRGGMCRELGRNATGILKEWEIGLNSFDLITSAHV